MGECQCAPNGSTARFPHYSHPPCCVDAVDRGAYTTTARRGCCLSAPAISSPHHSRLIRAGWLRSEVGMFSRWFDATAKRPGWCLYQVTPKMAALVQDYLDELKAAKGTR